MIRIRRPEDIYQARGEIENGTFSGRWHFAFDGYSDSEYVQFGNLRVFNDDTLSPGAVWPLHPHRDIEVVTYCVDGEFRHADEHGKGGILKKGWVQHTTVGEGMWHSEINDRSDVPLRFIQMWFIPSEHDAKPSVEQKRVEREDRANRLCPLVAANDPAALPLKSDASVLSCMLYNGAQIGYTTGANRGVYLYVLEGGPVMLDGHSVPPLGAAMVVHEQSLSITAGGEAELLLVDTAL